MADATRWTEMFGVLCAAFDKEPTPERTEVYWRLFGQWPDERWAAAVERAIKAERFFPVPAVLFGAEAGAEATFEQAEAVAIFDRAVRVWNTAQYNRQEPRSEVMRQLGQAAATAMEAAGGEAAAQCERQDEPFVRKAFIEAYARTQRAAREGVPLPERMLPAPLARAQALLPPGASEAGGMLRDLEREVGRRGLKLAPKPEPEPAMRLDDYEARMSLLRKQRREIEESER